MNRSRPPKLGSLLLRIRGLGDRRAEVEADLLELFTTRARHYGERYASRRYYGDVLSLWRPSGMRTVQSAHPPKSSSVLREIGQDLTYAVRLLRRSPGVVAVTVLGLGLAIGVSTAVFSLLNAVAFRPTGIADPASAVRVMRAYRNGMGNAWRYADYLLLRDGARSVRLEASLRGGASISTTPGTDVAETASLLFVSGGYLSALSNRTFLGRALTAADDVQGAPPVAVVSYVSWSRRLGAATTIIGQPILVEWHAVHRRGREPAWLQRYAGHAAGGLGTARELSHRLRRPAARPAFIDDREHRRPGHERRTRMPRPKRSSALSP